MSEAVSGRGELILYATEDGRAKFTLRAEGGTVWLTQLELAELFQSSVPNINIHIKNLLAEGELTAEGTIKKSLIVRTEGRRKVNRPVKLYNLDMILAVGYRVRSPRGTQFRQWATVHLKEYLVKGFVMDDARLKEPGGWDYFDELLQRIRDIRASEKRFYQKVRDLFALSSDYRDDPKQPNMALTAWKSGRVRKDDVIVAKNYLRADEIDQLNRIVTMFLDFAEFRAQQRSNILMADWRQNVDSFIQFNERPLLQSAGRISHEKMVQIAHERYAEFDSKRRESEALQADKDDIKALEAIDRRAGASKKRPKS